MKLSSAIFIGILCMVIAIGFLPLQTRAADGVARLWTLDSAGNKISAREYTMWSGWSAQSYLRNPTNNWARLLWSNSSNGGARLWTLNADGVKSGITSYDGTFGAGWVASSYDRNWATGEARMAWSNPTNGSARVWILDASGVKTAVRNYDGYFGAGWQITSYQQNWSNGWARMVWSNSTNGAARVWTLNDSGVRSGVNNYDGFFGAGWAVTSYERNWATGVARMVWTNSTTGQARVWTLDTNGVKTAVKSYDGTFGAGWSATSYNQPPSSSGGATLRAVSEETLVVKKAGSGSGTITAGTQVCDAACTELEITYIAGKEVDVNVTAAADSYFAGWETAGGVQIENIYYAEPGDTVFAIFEQK